MSEPINTRAIRLYPDDAINIIDAEREFPVHFVMSGPTDQYNRLVLEHYIDGNDTTLQIELCPNGTWSATKHIEV